MRRTLEDGFTRLQWTASPVERARLREEAQEHGYPSLSAYVVARLADGLEAEQEMLAKSISTRASFGRTQRKRRGEVQLGQSDCVVPVALKERLLQSANAHGCSMSARVRVLMGVDPDRD